MSGRRKLSLQVPTELALVGVSVATLVGFRRLFLDWSFLAKPLVAVLVSHLLAAVLRRRRTPIALAALVSAVVLVVLGSWLFYASTTRFGVPGIATFDAFTADLRAAIELFRDVEAPAEALPGFVAGTAIALWVTAFLADWAAFRLWAPFEAVLPSAGLFVFASLFGADQYRAGAAAVFLASVLAFLLLHRAWRLESSAAWIRGDAQRGSRALVRAGVGLAAAALIIGAATGPLLPGAKADALFDWKDLGGGDGTRVTLSPLVDIQSRLVQDSNTEVFTVRSDRRAYWRLTALDAFDGRVWKSSRRFSRVNGDLPAQTATHASTMLVQQEFDISGLAQIWLPAAFEPREIEAPGLLTRWEPTTSTLIVDRQTSDGLQYDVTSAYPNYVAGDLRQATGPPPDDIAKQFLELPADFSPKVAALAEQVASSATTPFDKALALQSYFRSGAFTYSTAVSSGHGDNRLESFLFDEKKGYCEQFAGAFAAMARSIGLPARVAVGFTPGDVDAADPTLYHVRGKHAHAWPEVYLTGYGWVLFEPTPSRGAPNAGYTGVTEAQDPTSPIPAVTGDVTTTTAPTLSTDEIDPNLEPLPGSGSAPVEPVPEDTSNGGGGRGGWAGWLLMVLLGVGALYVVAVLGGRAARRLVRRRRARTARARIDVAWREAVESLGVLGIEPNPAETPLELASRAGRQARLNGPELHDLAALTTEARYAPDRAATEDDTEVTRARRGAAAVADRVRATTTAPQRLGYHLSPRARLSRARHHRGPRRTLAGPSTPRSH